MQYAKPSKVKAVPSQLGHVLGTLYAKIFICVKLTTCPAAITCKTIHLIPIAYQRVGRLSMQGWCRPAHSARALEILLNSPALACEAFLDTQISYSGVSLPNDTTQRAKMHRQTYWQKTIKPSICSSFFFLNSLLLLQPQEAYVESGWSYNRDFCTNRLHSCVRTPFC